jgi:hypothetical protein
MLANQSFVPLDAQQLNAWGIEIEAPTGQLAYLVRAVCLKGENIDGLKLRSDGKHVVIECQLSDACDQERLEKRAVVALLEQSPSTLRISITWLIKKLLINSGCSAE